MKNLASFILEDCVITCDELRNAFGNIDEVLKHITTKTEAQANLAAFIQKMKRNKVVPFTDVITAAKKMKGEMSNNLGHLCALIGTRPDFPVTLTQELLNNYICYAIKNNLHTILSATSVLMALKNLHDVVNVGSASGDPAIFHKICHKNLLELMVHSSSHMIKNDFFVKLYKALNLLFVTCINAKHYLHLNQVFKNNHSNPETRFNTIPKPNMMMSLFHNINNGANQDTVYTRVWDYVSPSFLLPALSLNSNVVDNSLVILDVSKQVQEDPKSLMAMIGGEVPYHFKTMFSVGNLFHTVDGGKECWEKIVETILAINRFTLMHHSQVWDYTKTAADTITPLPDEGILKNRMKQELDSIFPESNPLSRCVATFSFFLKSRFSGNLFTNKYSPLMAKC